MRNSGVSQPAIVSIGEPDVAIFAVKLRMKNGLWLARDHQRGGRAEKKDLPIPAKSALFTANAAC